jgi:hypothetical protein
LCGDKIVASFLKVTDLVADAYVAQYAIGYIIQHLLSKRIAAELHRHHAALLFGIDPRSLNHADWPVGVVVKQQRRAI